MSGCYVRTAPGDMVEIMMPMGGGLAEGLLVSRSEARLLAKRINECLDTTVIR